MTMILRDDPPPPPPPAAYSTFKQPLSFCHPFTKTGEFGEILAEKSGFLNVELAAGLPRRYELVCFGIGA